LLPDAAQPDAEDEAFTYQNVGGDVLFWGGNKRGTLYAVYSFLEKELDCRWYSHKVSVAPKKVKFAFSELSNHEEPGIRMRDICYWVARRPQWAARLRNNSVPIPRDASGGDLPGTAVRYWNCHTFEQFVPAKKYFDSHPEYFSMKDGKRIKEYTQLCLTNPDVLKLCTEGIRNAMKTYPDFLVYSLSQNDWYNPCQCDKCKVLVEKYGGESGILLWFVNQVADAIRDEFPDKYVGTFAYQYTRHPPVGIKPHDNVVIRLCSIECCLLHDYDECDLNKDFTKDLKTWASIAPHLYIWDYVATFTQYCMPMPNFETLQSHIKDYQNYHAIGIMEEGDYQGIGGEMEELRSYVISKLLWNPDCDVEEVIMDFTDGYYGAAGKFIREYLDYEHTVLRRDGIHQNCFPRPNSPMYTDDFVRESRKIFAKAKEAVQNDEELLHRVETAEMPLCFLQLVRTPEEAKQAGALDLFNRVVERDGIKRLAEWGGYLLLKDFQKYLDETFK